MESWICGVFQAEISWKFIGTKCLSKASVPKSSFEFSRLYWVMSAPKTSIFALAKFNFGQTRFRVWPNAKCRIEFSSFQIVRKREYKIAWLSHNRRGTLTFLKQYRHNNPPTFNSISSLARDGMPIRVFQFSNCAQTNTKSHDYRTTDAAHSHQNNIDTTIHQRSQQYRHNNPPAFNLILQLCCFKIVAYLLLLCQLLPKQSQSSSHQTMTTLRNPRRKGRRNRLNQTQHCSTPKRETTSK